MASELGVHFLIMWLNCFLIVWHNCFLIMWHFLIISFCDSPFPDFCPFFWLGFWPLCYHFDLLEREADSFVPMPPPPTIWPPCVCFSVTRFVSGPMCKAPFKTCVYPPCLLKGTLTHAFSASPDSWQTQWHFILATEGQHVVVTMGQRCGDETSGACHHTAVMWVPKLFFLPDLSDLPLHENCPQLSAFRQWLVVVPGPVGRLGSMAWSFGWHRPRSLTWLPSARTWAALGGPKKL